MRGNGLNCLRIAPYSAVQFATYESVKTWLSHPVQHEYKTAQGDSQTYTEKELDTLGRLCAGAIAGFTSVVSTYPLDLVRSRISIASASMYVESGQSATVMDRVPGIMETACKVYTEEGGLRGLYRGCLPTSLGVAPYVAFNFVFYESARTMLTKDDGTPPGPIAKLCLGAWAGAVSQTLTYPLDVIRRRMQVSGMRDSKLGVQDKSTYTMLTRRRHRCHSQHCKTKWLPGSVLWPAAESSQGRSLHGRVLFDVRSRRQLVVPIRSLTMYYYMHHDHITKDIYARFRKIENRIVVFVDPRTMD